MRIYELLWPRDRIDHIARHAVTPDEVEQVCFGQPLVQRAKSYGEKPVLLCAGINRYRSVSVVGCHLVSGWQGISSNRAAYDRQRETPIPTMERKMKTEALPQTDSIQELAEFWDKHDLTDFEDDLEEVSHPVFTPRTAIRLELESAEAEAVRKIAEAKGIAEAELIRGWVREKIGVG